MNKGVAVIATILLIFSALAPAIALSEQLGERGLNDTGNITNTTMPELFVKDITVSSPLYPNETAQINTIIRNNGTDSGKFNVSFLVDSALKDEKTIESLNESEMISFDWIPDEAKNYSLKVVADSNNGVTESNETNNELEVEVAVLMRTTVVINASNETENASLNSTAAAILDEYATISEATSEVNFVPENISAIMPGETKNVSIVLNSTEDVCWFRADVHFNPAVVEITNASTGDFPYQFTMVHHENYVSLLGFDSTYSDKPPGKWVLANLSLKANNLGRCNLSFNPAETYLTNISGMRVPATWNNATFIYEIPDLIIKEKTEEWIIKDSTYNVTYMVKNIGASNANASNTSIKIDGTEVAADPVPELAPDASYTRELGPFTLSNGSDTIEVCADKDNAVLEHNETNNCVIGVMPTYNVSMTAEPMEKIVCRNETANYTLVITNSGKLRDTFKLNVTLNESQFYSLSNDTFLLDIGENATAYLNVSDMELGFYNTTVRAISQSDESILAEVTVKTRVGVPDLVVTAKSEECLNASYYNTTYNVTYTVKNVGNASACASNTSIKIDGTEVAADPVPLLTPDASYTSELGPFTFSNNSDTIEGCADINNTVPESNETNNCIGNVFTFGVLNGDFESDGGWTTECIGSSSGNTIAADLKHADDPHVGNYCAKIEEWGCECGHVPWMYGYIRQRVRLAPDASYLLYYAKLVRPAESPGWCKGGRVSEVTAGVRLKDSSGTVFGEITEPAHNDWQQRKINVSEHAGEIVTIEIFFIDKSRSGSFTYGGFLAVDDFFIARNTPVPDIVPLSLAPSLLAVNQPNNLTADVWNNGAVNVSSFNVSLKVEDTVVDTKTVPSLCADCIMPVVFSWTPESFGDLNLTIVADTENNITEVDETNNARVKKVYVADLSITPEIASRPYITYANRTNVVVISLERSGTYSPSVDLNVTLSSTPESPAVSEVITMSRNEKRYSQMPWTTNGTGNYSLKLDVRTIQGLELGSAEITPVVSPPLFDYSANVASALDFLDESQSPSGSLSGFTGSTYAALAIIAAGEDPSSSTGRWKPYKDSLISYLRNKPKSSVEPLPIGSNPPDLCGIEDFARMILVISAVGEDPTNFGDVNYLTMLKSYYDGEQFGERDDVKDDAFAILALVACDDKNQRTEALITNATGYIKARQNGDGGWSSFGVGSDVRTTSLVIQALIAAGKGKNSETITDALNYLKNAQGDDGGYSDVISTSYAIQAFIAAGEDLSNYSKTIDYLLSLQQPDGSFNYTKNMSFFPPRMTIFPVLALCGEPYPVMIKTTNKSYELPDISVSDIVTEDEICVNTSYTVKTNISSNGGIFYVDLLSDGEFVERKMVYSVWHDSLTPLSFTWKPGTTGDHNLTIFLDSMNNITESDETNNNATIKGNVTLPDLYPSDITPPDNVYVNVTNVIDCTIKGTTDEHFNVTLEAGGELLGKQQVEGIRDNFTLSFDWRPSENKAYNLRLTVDSDAEVRERDDANNTLERPVTVLLPDLIPASITADEIFVNARNDVNVTIEGMAECFNISLVKNGTVVGKTTNVTCYGKENVTVYWKPRGIGNHAITAFVDSDNDIVETNETNNNITKTFEVLLPDLVPEDITPDVFYIDEVNTINVKVNGTAEGFNATLVADEIVDRSGPLCFLIAPIFNGTFGISETLSGTTTDSNLTYNITAQRTDWSWADIDTLSVSIASTTSTGLVDNGDTWSVDYVAVVVNYTLNSTNQTLELNASDIVSHGNWSNGNNTNISDDEYATTTEITTLQLDITDTDAVGNITSVVIKVEQHVVDAVPTKKGTTLKKANLNTYNGSIAFEWLPMKLGEYKLSVFMDSDNDTAETNEMNNNLSKSVIVAKRIDLELTSPLGGETWEGIQNITWNASYGEPLLIDFYYSPDRGYRWINITTNETNDGSYAWNTEDVIDGEYMIKIVARAGMVTAEDLSDVFFVRNTKAGMESGQFPHPYSPCDAPDTNEIAWISDDIGAEGSSSLIVADGKIFVYCTGWGGMYSDYTYLVALDQSSGEVLWGTKIAPRVYGSWATPTYKDGSVFVSSGNGVYRIDADDGKKIWTFNFPGGYGSVNGGPAVTKRAVYVGDWDGGNYYCIDKNNRNVLWKFPVSGRAQSVPAIGYGNVYFGSFYYGGDSKAYAVNAWDGKEIWETGVTYDVCGSVTISDKVVYFTTANVGASGGMFYALEAFNGSVIWSKPISYTDSSPTFYAPSKSPRSYVYVTGEWAGPGKTHCFDAKTGELIWEVSGVGFWTNSPAVTRDGKVFAGKPGGTFGYAGLYCLDAFTGEELWHSDYGGSSPVVVNGFVYTIGSGRVFVFGNGTRPDLTVEAGAPDKKCVAGTKENINATIKNIGTLNVTKSFKVELRYQGDLENPIDEKTIDRLNVNETEPITFDWPLPEWPTKEETRDYRLTVEVDPSNNVSESGWGDNNFANVTVTVHDNKPDLTTSITSVSPGTIYVGDMVTVKANITNIGYEMNKSQSFWVRFSVDDEEENMNWTSLVNNTPFFTWNVIDNGTYNLTVDANPGDNLTIKNEVTWANNDASTKVVVTMPTPTPTPTPTPPRDSGIKGRGSRGIGNGPGGIGSGSGTGEAGAGEAGGMQIPVNESSSASGTKKEVSGYPFGNATSGASGGGGTLPIFLMLLAILVIALFYFGYYKEKRAYRGNKK